LKVLRGKRSLVGYIPRVEAGMFRLPSIRKGILHPADLYQGHELSEHDRDRLNMLYAKNYKPSTDLEILWNSFRRLGRREQKARQVVG